MFNELTNEDFEEIMQVNLNGCTKLIMKNT